jgi:phospholipase/carboxylesterase
MDFFTLDGPRVDPISGRAPKQLIILLHGLGADGNDLIGLAPHWAENLPDAAFSSPNAPFPCDMSPMGYQWFSVQDRSPSAMLAGVRAAAPILNDFIDQELKRVGLGPDKLAIVGFSQGTMMSLYVIPRRDEPVAGVIGYSGRLVGPEQLQNETISRPPFLLIHGEDDEMVTFDSMALAEQGLEAAGIPVNTVARPGLGHGIDHEGLTHGGAFLKAAFAG